MKNTLTVDIDSDRENTVIIGKPSGVHLPTNKAELAPMIIDDMATLCEALCTMIRLAEDQGVKPSAQSLRDCIKHLTDGFADPSYATDIVRGYKEKS